jgi:hypothetical protein
LLRELIGGWLYAEPRPGDLAVADELRDDVVDLVYRDGKTDSRESTGRAVDGRVDSDKPAGAVQERPTRVA